jgi:hypothetical protein
LTLPTREGARWRLVEEIQAIVTNLLFGERDTRCRLQVRSVLREGKALTRLPVIPAPFNGMECCGTTKTGSIR